MEKNGFEVSDEALNKVVGGTMKEYNAIVKILRKHGLCVYDENGKLDFVASFNNAMAEDPTNKNGKFRLLSAEISNKDENVYHFYLEGFGDLGEDSDGVLLAMLKGFYDE